MASDWSLIMSQYEINKNRLEKDVRSVEEKILEWFLDLNHFRFFILCRIVSQLLLIAFWPVSLVTSLFIWAIIIDRKVKLPMRIPKDIGGPDLTGITQ